MLASIPFPALGTVRFIFFCWGEKMVVMSYSLDSSKPQGFGSADRVFA